MKIQIPDILLFAAYIIRAGYLVTIFITAFIFLSKRQFNRINKIHLLEVLNYSILFNALFQGLYIALTYLLDKSHSQVLFFIVREFGPFIPQNFPPMIAILILPHLYWNRKIRRNMFISFMIMMVITLIPFLYPLIIQLSNKNRDYISSPDVFNFPTIKALLGTIPFIIIYIIFIYPVYIIYSRIQDKKTT